MSFTAAFSVAQSTSNNALLTVNDISTGSDGAITQRRIYLQKSDGSYLTPTGTVTSYINFPISAGASITSSVLTQDFSLQVTLQWLDVNNNILYTSTNLFVFTAYAESFAYQLTQYQTSNDSLITNTNYYGNKIRLRVDIDDANQAVTLAGNIGAAQTVLNDAAYLIANQQTFY